MRVAIVSRHKSTIDFVKAMFRDVTVLEHVNDIEELKDFDLIVGNLPLPMVAEIKRMGKRFVMVSLNIPKELRGKELTLEELHKFAELIEVEELKIKPFTI